MIWRKSCFASLLLVASALPAWAIELRFEYPALERMLSQQLFTEDGVVMYKEAVRRNATYDLAQKLFRSFAAGGIGFTGFGD